MTRRKAPLPAETSQQTSDDAAQIRERTRANKARFDAAHRKGMDALRRHDYATLGEAVAEESAAIDDQVAGGAPSKPETAPRKHTVEKP